VIILDTSFLIALLNNRDNNHPQALVIMEDLLVGKYGNRVVLDYILDEAITTTWIRTQNEKLVENMYQLINGSSSVIELQTVYSVSIEKIWKTYNKYFSKVRPISFTDAAIITYAEKHKIQKIVSFDKEFDGLMIRIC
jgi:uncharacterized protein